MYCCSLVYKSGSQ